MSDSVRPLSPGKNTGVGCHFLLQCMKVKSEREVTQSCPTLSDPMDYSLPGSSVHGIFQARLLEWGAIAFSGSCIQFSLNMLVQFIVLNAHDNLLIRIDIYTLIQSFRMLTFLQNIFILNIYLYNKTTIFLCGKKKI